MRITKLNCIVLALSAVFLSACSDVQDKMHEPGVYKGKIDPLLAKSGEEQDKILAERFRSIQTDR